MSSRLDSVADDLAADSLAYIESRVARLADRIATRSDAPVADIKEELLRETLNRIALGGFVVVEG